MENQTSSNDGKTERPAEGFTTTNGQFDWQKTKERESTWFDPQPGTTTVAVLAMKAPVEVSGIAKGTGKPYKFVKLPVEVEIFGSKAQKTWDVTFDEEGYTSKSVFGQLKAIAMATPDQNIVGRILDVTVEMDKSGKRRFTITDKTDIIRQMVAQAAKR